MPIRACFYGDGLALTPPESASLLARLTTNPNVLAPDNYSRNGVAADRNFNRIVHPPEPV